MEGERRAREAEKTARESSRRKADQGSAPTGRASAPKRGRPEESVDLTSDGDEGPAEPSPPPRNEELPARPRTTSQGPATQPPPPALAPKPKPGARDNFQFGASRAASGRFDCGAFGCTQDFVDKAALMQHRRDYQHWPKNDQTSEPREVEPTPAPADTSRAAGRDRSASSSTPKTARTRDTVDLDEEPAAAGVSMQMKQVQLGTFYCGACEVAFSEKAIRFYTDEATRFQPHGYHEEIELEISALTRIEIDKEKSILCVSGFFGYHVEGYYSPFATGPESRVLLHLATGEGAGVWNGSDRAAQVKSLMRLSPDIKQKTGFNPTGRDFANELRLFKRRQTGEEHGDEAPAPARTVTIATPAATTSGLAPTSAPASAPAPATAPPVPAATASSMATSGNGASATSDFGVEGWEPFDDVQLVNGITTAAGWINTAVDPSLEIAGLSEEGWEEMACFEIVSDATDYVNANGKVSRSTRVVRDRILQAQRQFGMTSAALIAFERDAKRRIYRAAKSTPTPRSDLGAGFDQPGSAMSSLPGPGRRPSALSGTPAPHRNSLLGAASGQRVSGSPLNGAGGGAASKTPRSGGAVAACTTPACPTASASEVKSLLAKAFLRQQGPVAVAAAEGGEGGSADGVGGTAGASVAAQEPVAQEPAVVEEAVGQAEVAEVAEVAEAVEAAEAAEAAEEEAMVRRLLALRQYIEMRSEMRRMAAPKAFKKPWHVDVK